MGNDRELVVKVEGHLGYDNGAYSFIHSFIQVNLLEA